MQNLHQRTQLTPHVRHHSHCLPFRTRQLCLHAELLTAPTTWNSLPADILTCDSESGFKLLLKTHLFNNCVNVAWLTHSQRLCSSAYGALQICLWYNYDMIYSTRFCYKLSVLGFSTGMSCSQACYHNVTATCKFCFKSSNSGHLLQLFQSAGHWRTQVIRGSFHKKVTKWHHSVNFQTMKIPKYTFCRGFNSQYELWVLSRWCHYNVI